MPVLGAECKLYHNTGTYGTPTWDEVTNAIDVTINGEWSVGEIKSRGNRNVKVRRAMLSWSLEWNMIYVNDNSDWDAFQAAHADETSSIDVAAFDGAIATSGNQGLRSEMEIVSMSREEPLEEGVTVSFTARPSDTTNDPTWLETA